MEPRTFELMPVNDPRHTVRVVKDWLSKEKISFLGWPAQRPGLNPKENLSNDI